MCLEQLLCPTTYVTKQQWYEARMQNIIDDDGYMGSKVKHARLIIATHPRGELMIEQKLWLWKNFVDGKSEYWAFDSLYPRDSNGDPLVVGEPCGYALVKESIPYFDFGAPSRPAESKMTNPDQAADKACEQVYDEWLKIWGGPVSKMTKRELFAAMAMQGLIARGTQHTAELPDGKKLSGSEATAHYAVTHADALLSALEKK